MDHQNKRLFLSYYFRSRQFLFLLLLIFYTLLFSFCYLFEDERAVLQYVLLILLLISLAGFLLDIVKQYQNFRHLVFYGEGQAQTPLEALLFYNIKKSRVIYWIITHFGCIRLRHRLLRASSWCRIYKSRRSKINWSRSCLRSTLIPT